MASGTQLTAPETMGTHPVAGLYRLSVAQFRKMIGAGVLTQDDRVELLEGLLVPKTTKNTPHIVCTDLLQHALIRLVPGGWYVSMQNPVTTLDSAPEPDALVVRGHPRDYIGRPVGPDDVAMVVEVANTRQADDRTIKKRIYARAGLAIYWIINLPESRVEVYDDPSGPSDPPDYRRRRDYGLSDVVPLMIEGRDAGGINVRDLLP